jgi:hypothetical protein
MVKAAAYRPSRDLTSLRATKFVQAAAFSEHDTANNANERHWRTLFRRKAMADLFARPYEAR